MATGPPGKSPGFFLGHGKLQGRGGDVSKTMLWGLTPFMFFPIPPLLSPTSPPVLPPKRLSHADLPDTLEDAPSLLRPARLSSQPCRGCARLFLGGPQWPPHPQGGTDLPLCCPVISDDNLPLPPGGPLASFCQLNLSTQTARMVRKQNRGLCWGVWTEGVTAGAHPSQGSALNRGPAGRR